MVVWWTSLARIFLGGLTVYDNHNDWLFNRIFLFPIVGTRTIFAGSSCNDIVINEGIG